MTSKQWRLARVLVLGTAAVGLMAATKPAPASDSPVAVTRAVFAAFNRGDMAAAGATLAPELSIVDNFPPYAWRGAGAWEAWQADYAKTGFTDGKLPVTVLDSRVSGDDAYVLVHGVFTFKDHGRRMSETGNEGVALHKGDNGWKITGWGWAGDIHPHAVVAKAKPPAAAPAAPAKP